jgi:hypothetical protein
VRRQQFHDEPGLFENAQGLGLGHAHQMGDARGLLFAQRDIRHALDTQFCGAAVTPKAVQQHPAARRIDTDQRLLDTPLRDRGQEARFGSPVPQAVTLIAEIQVRSFHRFAHRPVLRAGAG